MPAKKKAKSGAARLSLTLDPEETKQLAEFAKAYPDSPSLNETARRILDMELLRKQRG